MDRKLVHKIIENSAKLYNDNLVGKDFMILYTEDTRYKFIEVTFDEGNFAHLTGVKLNGISAKVFLDRATSGKLALNDYKLNKDGTTLLKLQVIEQLMLFPTKFSMIGVYNNSGVRLSTDKLAGNVKGSIGFIKPNGRYYVPNTLTNGDIRTKVVKANKINAVYVKHKLDGLYDGKPLYTSKDLIGKDIVWGNKDIESKLTD